MLACIECGASSGLRAAGRRGYRIDDPADERNPPAVAFYCPACSRREFRIAD